MLNKENKKGRLIVISSVSGGGKTTVIDQLKLRNRELVSIITATSRKPREGEVEGEHYQFLSAEEFEKKLANNGFLEHARVHGNLYGVPRQAVEDVLHKGKHVVLNIDVQGMRTVKEIFHEQVITIFLLPPDEKIWEERLRSRGTDPEAEIQRRLKEGRAEIACKDEFDYQVLNFDLIKTIEGVEDILRKENVLPAEK